MPRKLHRRSSHRAFFPTPGEKGGEYTNINAGKRGFRDLLDNSRNDVMRGMYGETDYPFHRADEIMRLVESGFDDDAIAELLMIPVEDIAIIIEEDRKRELTAMDVIRKVAASL